MLDHESFGPGKDEVNVALVELAGLMEDLESEVKNIGKRVCKK